MSDATPQAYYICEEVTASGYSKNQLLAVGDTCCHAYNPYSFKLEVFANGSCNADTHDQDTTALLYLGACTYLHTQ